MEEKEKNDDCCEFLLETKRGVLASNLCTVLSWYKQEVKKTSTGISVHPTCYELLPIVKRCVHAQRIYSGILLDDYITKDEEERLLLMTYRLWKNQKGKGNGVVTTT
jgi:hypothetical protein